MKTTLLSFASLFICVILNAQNSLSGTLADWDNPKAEIITGMHKPLAIGDIDDKGNFLIELDAALAQSIRKDIKGFNEASDEWKTSLNSIDQSFKCHTETVETLNGEQLILSLTTFGMFNIADIPAQKMYGSFMMVNSKSFAEGVKAFGKYQNKEGYYIDMYYFEEAATVKGSCGMDSYTISGEMYEAKNVYELNFKPGWNIVQYQVTEIFRDKDGLTYEKTIVWKTLDKLPKDLQFVYFPK
ncbi:hypothetical protein [Eudoraea chungangensis]|uniref:hypothetical protein n=1 Tax=Eudoraea chungangensis TaxID=1481905 RepID=UPI0023EC7D23|nr:hypothetical protein [Eudoraea chungangensis]